MPQDQPPEFVKFFVAVNEAASEQARIAANPPVAPTVPSLAETLQTFSNMPKAEGSSPSNASTFSTADIVERDFPVYLEPDVE
jgi:hypothetical protein